ncbi:MAG: glycosyltransferase [Novosphingobium sp.]|nr:glycosyltransferase [Novosphingobium sp.]
MKIVDVCAFYSPRGGGVRTYVEQKLAIGPQLGHEIVILAPGRNHAVIERGERARIVTIPSPRLPVDHKYHYFDDEAALHRALDNEAPDFVEVSSPWRSPSLVARWQGAAPRSLVMHADPLAAYLYRWFGPVLSRPTLDRMGERFWDHLRKLSRAFDLTVCANDDLARRMIAGGLVNVATHPMGVDDTIFAPGRRDPALRAELLRQCSLPPSAGLLIAVGRLAPEKRLPMLIEAATAASRRQPLGLVILGEGRDKRAVRRAIAGNPHIRLFAPETRRERYAAILASADALLHGCEAETFCMAAAEARACGVPVIVPDRGGASDHARGGAGRCYASGNPQAAADAIVALLRETTLPQPSRPRSNFDHFAELFDAYAALAGDRRLFGTDQGLPAHLDLPGLQSGGLGLAAY